MLDSERSALSDARSGCVQGKRMLHMGQTADAALFFEQAVDADPEYAEAFVLLAYARIQLAKYERAVEACKYALQLRPADPYASFYLGLAYSRLGSEEAALK